MRKALELLLADQEFDLSAYNRRNFFTRTGLVASCEARVHCDSPILHVESQVDRFDLLVTSPFSGKHFICPAGKDVNGRIEVCPSTSANGIGIRVRKQAYEQPLSCADYPKGFTPDAFMFLQRQLSECWAHIIEKAIVGALSGLCANECEETQKVNTAIVAGNSSIDPWYAKIISDDGNVPNPTRMYNSCDEKLTCREAVNATGAVAPDSPSSPHGLTFELINEVSARLKDSTVPAHGIAIEKSSVRSNDDSTNMREAWVWLITPEHGYMLRELVQRSGDAKLKAEFAFGTKTYGVSGIAAEAIGSIADILFVTYNGLPRYFGGASRNVNIARTLILGRYAACMALRRKALPDKLLAKFKLLDQRDLLQKMPFAFCMAENETGERDFCVDTSIDLSIRKITLPSTSEADKKIGKKIDKGVIAIDMPYKPV